MFDAIGDLRLVAGLTLFVYLAGRRCLEPGLPAVGIGIVATALTSNLEIPTAETCSPCRPWWH